MTQQPAPPAKRPKIVVLFNDTATDDATPDTEAPAALADDGSVETSVDASSEAPPTADSDTGGAVPTFEFEDIPTSIVPLPVKVVSCADMVCGALESAGYEALAFNLDDDVDRVGHAMVVHKPDVVFNLVDEMWEDPLQQGHVAGLFDMYGYPHTGADSLTLASCQDRARTRLTLRDARVAVPRFAIVRDLNVLPDTEFMRFPLIVTQSFDDTYEAEGQTHAVADRQELEARIQELAEQYDLPLLIEEYLRGRQIHVIVIGNRALEVLPVVERSFDDVLGTDLLAIAQLDLEQARYVKQLAQAAFQATGCRDLAQIDMVIYDHGASGEGIPVVTDVRPMVELGHGSPFDHAAAASETGSTGVLATIAKLALDRAGLLEEDDDAAPVPTEEPASNTETAANPD